VSKRTCIESVCVAAAKLPRLAANVSEEGAEGCRDERLRAFGFEPSSTQRRRTASAVFVAYRLKHTSSFDLK
jgi:hypothetical protein